MCFIKEFSFVAASRVRAKLNFLRMVPFFSLCNGAFRKGAIFVFCLASNEPRINLRDSGFKMTLFLVVKGIDFVIQLEAKILTRLARARYCGK